MMRIVCACVGLLTRSEVEKRVEAFVGDEGSGFDSFVFAVVVRELGERKELGPVGLLVIGVDAEVLLQCLVGTLGLSVCLRTEGGAEGLLDAKELTE